MDASQYGPFAYVIAIAAALVASFSMLLLKAVGQVSRWTWLIDGTPNFIVTTSARALCVVFIAATFVLINATNAWLFLIAALAFGFLAVFLVKRFDFLRRVHTCAIPQIQENGTIATDKNGKGLYRHVVIGSEYTMRPEAASAYERARKNRGGLSPCDFMSGYGSTKVNDPAAIWKMDELAKIGNEMTHVLVGIVLSAVMALYLAASVVEIFVRK